MKEIIENSYMEALLRAALLFGDLRRKEQVQEVTIAAYWMDAGIRRISHRCRMTALDRQEMNSMDSKETVVFGKEYLILYPRTRREKL